MLRKHVTLYRAPRKTFVVEGQLTVSLGPLRASLFGMRIPVRIALLLVAL